MSTVVDARAPPAAAKTVAVPVYANRFRNRLPLASSPTSGARGPVIEKQAGVQVVREVHEERRPLAHELELAARGDLRVLRRPSAGAARADARAPAGRRAPRGITASASSRRARALAGSIVRAVRTPARTANDARLGALRRRTGRSRTRTRACRRHTRGSSRRPRGAPRRRAVAFLRKRFANICARAVRAASSHPAARGARFVSKSSGRCRSAAAGTRSDR